MLTLRDGGAVDARGLGFDCAYTGAAPGDANKAIATNAGAMRRVILAALIGRDPGRAASRGG